MGYLVLSVLLTLSDDISTEVVSDATRAAEPITTDGEVIDQVAVIRQEPHAFRYQIHYVNHGSRVWMAVSVMAQLGMIRR